MQQWKCNFVLLFCFLVEISAILIGFIVPLQYCHIFQGTEVSWKTCSTKIRDTRINVSEVHSDLAIYTIRQHFVGNIMRVILFCLVPVTMTMRQIEWKPIQTIPYLNIYWDVRKTLIYYEKHFISQDLYQGFYICILVVILHWYTKII